MKDLTCNNDPVLLNVSHLTKQYKDFTLSDISFCLKSGYIMGYVGRNGAGKTTTLSAITHLIPSQGEVMIDGVTFDKDPVAYRNSIGYVGDASYFPAGLSAANVRSILKDFYPSFRPDAFDQYLEKWEIPQKPRITTFSRGMKVKLMFACVLSRDTRLLVLDEATNGLDPVVRREILSLLQDYISDGAHSVLFSTHIMEDLAQIADYVFFIDHGKKIFCEEKDVLVERYRIVRGGPEDLTPQLKDLLIGVTQQKFGFEGLFDTECGVSLPDGLLTETPSIDEIVLHFSQDVSSFL